MVIQEYKNDCNEAVEGKFVFPLGENAAVCGFEAFINGKHITGNHFDNLSYKKNVFLNLCADEYVMLYLYVYHQYTNPIHEQGGRILYFCFIEGNICEDAV